jgi:hypothetical protein
MFIPGSSFTANDVEIRDLYLPARTAAALSPASLRRRAGLVRFISHHGR